MSLYTEKHGLHKERSALPKAIPRSCKSRGKRWFRVVLNDQEITSSLIVETISPISADLMLRISCVDDCATSLWYLLTYLVAFVCSSNSGFCNEVGCSAENVETSWRPLKREFNCVQSPSWGPEACGILPLRPAFCYATACTHIHICMYVYVCIHIHRYIFICMYIYAYIYIHIFNTYRQRYRCLQINIDIYEHTHVRKQTYIHLCVYICVGISAWDLPRPCNLCLDSRGGCEIVFKNRLDEL